MAMNRGAVVDLVVDLVDDGLVDVVPAVFSFFAPRLFLGFLAPGCIGQGRPSAVFQAAWYVLLCIRACLEHVV